VALREWCSMARGEGERGRGRGGGEGGGLVAVRRWAFKTRRVWGSPLPPALPNLPCLAYLPASLFALRGLRVLAGWRALAPALDGPVHGDESAKGRTGAVWAAAEPIFELLRLVEEKARGLRGMGILLQRGAHANAGGARKWHARPSEALACLHLQLINQYFIRID